MRGYRGMNKCGRCTRFMSYRDHDQYTDFGNSYDIEPPDPILLCSYCSKELEEDLVMKGNIPYTPWRPARYHKRAADRLGWKYAHPKHASWGSYLDARKPLPDGWEWGSE